MIKPLLKVKAQTPAKDAETQVISNGRYHIILAKIEDGRYAYIHNMGQRPGEWICGEATELVAETAAFQKMDYEGYEVMADLNGLSVSWLTNGCVDEYDSRVQVPE
jgi:hypothetical protein